MMHDISHILITAWMLLISWNIRQIYKMIDGENDDLDQENAQMLAFNEGDEPSVPGKVISAIVYNVYCKSPSEQSKQRFVASFVDGNDAVHFVQYIAKADPYSDYTVYKEVHYKDELAEKTCDTCADYLGNGCCKGNLESECAAGGGYEAWKEKEEQSHGQ